MRAKQALTHNAILYSSVGFEQQCVLQVLHIRQAPSSYEMVLFDGHVYTGAIYHTSSNSKKNKTIRNKVSDQSNTKQTDFQNGGQPVIPRQLDIIRVKLYLAGNNQPLQRLVTELTIVEKGLTQILGKEILPLEEYMKRRKFIKHIESEEDEVIERSPQKKKKGQESPFNTSQFSSQQVKNGHEQLQKQGIEKQDNKIIKSLNQKEGMEQNDHAEGSILQLQSISESLANSEKINHIQKDRVIPNNPATINVKKESFKESQESRSNHHQIIELLMEEPPLVQIKNKRKNNKAYIDLIQDDALEESQLPTQKAPLQNITTEKNTKSQMMISDLYQRMLRFRILCRVNNINYFKSKKGIPCTKMMLIDEKGDEILCMIFDKADSQQQKPSLLKGRVYFFQNGEVEKDQNGFLYISVAWSNIEETKLVFSSFSPDKMMRVGQLQNIAADYFLDKTMNSSNKSINNKKACSKQLNICGIFADFKDEPKLINNQFRVSGILCDPEQQKSINFTLFVDQLASFPRSGAVISLHNLHVCDNQRIYRLEQSKRSYYLVQNNNSHKYFSDLKEASESGSWKLKDYANLSEVRFVVRTIEQLKSILPKMLQNDQCFSQIDCNIADVREIKEFLACGECHNVIKTDKGIRSYCYQCKKIQNVIKRFIFESEVADSTGSINVKVFSDEITLFINTSIEDYASMIVEERKAILELSSFQNVLLRVKSQQQIGGSTHQVTKAQKVSHKRGLEQIKEQSIASRTSYRPSWL